MKALILAMALAACAQQPARVVEPRATAASAPRGASLLRAAMFEGHNAARAAVGVAPLIWSDTLAASARRYAQAMARTGRFEHAAQPLGAGREGETLWTGTRYAYAYREMVGHWLAERKDFVNGATPAFSRTGRWEDVAHYTQIVWRGSTQFGCAMASSRTEDYLVCRYTPAGNVVGERAY